MDLDVERARLSECEKIEIDEDSTNIFNTSKEFSFIGGVIEGFYGSPWEMHQREHLIRTLNLLGLNAYIYAPKDDKKHRKHWRKLYTNTECETLKRIIDYAKNHDVLFIYAISPGLDMTYSAKEDREHLKSKFQQIKNLGAHGYGLFFDDIEAKLDENDSQLYDHHADAQVDVANTVYESLGCPEFFLFCPTEYCSSRAKPSVIGSFYLRTIGASLDERIQILWTGPRVISLSIPEDNIRDLISVINRKPVIWDNIYANDYDSRQIFLGPYKNRPLNIYPHLNGIFLNPNCQYELNFVPIYTFSVWVRAAEENKKLAINSEDSDDQSRYIPEKACHEVCLFWLEEFRKNVPFVGAPQIEQQSDYSETSSSTDSEYSKDMITLNRTDLCRIISFMYLPGLFGSFATSILSQFKQIKSAAANFWKKSGQTRSSSLELQEDIRRLKHTISKAFISFKRLRTSNNLALLNVLLPFVTETKEALQNLRSYASYLETRERKSPFDELFCDPEYLLNHSRFSSEVQRLLPSIFYRDPSSDLAEQPPVYVIRPPNDQDKERLEMVCYGHLTNQFGVWDDIRPARRISNLRTTYEMYVVEDTEGLCGYMLYKIVDDIDLEERLREEYDDLLLEIPNINDNLPKSFTTLPPIIPSIIREYPVKLFFCFQVGFKKGHVINRLIDIVTQRVKTDLFSGIHIVIDCFEFIEPLILKKCNFLVHPSGDSKIGKYYVLNLR